MAPPDYTLAIVLGTVLPLLALLLCTGGYYGYKWVFPPPKVYAKRALVIGGMTREQRKEEWAAKGAVALHVASLDEEDEDDATEAEDLGNEARPPEENAHHEALDFMHKVISAALTDVSEAEAEATSLVASALQQALGHIVQARGGDHEEAADALQKAAGEMSRASSKLSKKGDDSEGGMHGQALSLVASCVQAAVSDLEEKAVIREEARAAAAAALLGGLVAAENLAVVHASALGFTSGVVLAALQDLSREHEEHAATALVADLLRSALGSLGQAKEAHRELEHVDVEGKLEHSQAALEHTISCLGSAEEVQSLVEGGVMLEAHAEALGMVRGVVQAALEDILHGHANHGAQMSRQRSLAKLSRNASMRDLSPNLARQASLGGGSLDKQVSFRGSTKRSTKEREEVKEGGRKSSKKLSQQLFSNEPDEGAASGLNPAPAPSRMEQISLNNAKLAALLGEAALEADMQAQRERAQQRLEERRARRGAEPTDSLTGPRDTIAEAATDADAANAEAPPCVPPMRAGHPRLGPNPISRPAHTPSDDAHAAAASLLLREAEESVHLHEDLDSAHIRAQRSLQHRKEEAQLRRSVHIPAQSLAGQNDEALQMQRMMGKQGSTSDPSFGPVFQPDRPRAQLTRQPSRALPPPSSPPPPHLIRAASQAALGAAAGAGSGGGSAKRLQAPPMYAIDVHSEPETIAAASPLPIQTRPQLTRQPSGALPPPSSAPPAHLVRALSIAKGTAAWSPPSALEAEFDAALETAPPASTQAASDRFRPPPLMRQPSRIVPPPSAPHPLAGSPLIDANPESHGDGWHADTTAEHGEDWFPVHRQVSSKWSVKMAPQDLHIDDL